MRKHLLRFAGYFVGIFLAALAPWIDRTFGSPNIDQIRYHLYYADAAAFEMSQVFIVTFLGEVLAVSLVLAGLATLVHAWLARACKGRWARLLGAVPPVVVVAGLMVVLLEFSVFSYVAARFEKDHFAGSYVPPGRATFTQTDRRNLVLIYVESLEATYSDRALFGADLLQPLDALEGQRLPKYQMVPGATWTIGAMVATQCGVPLTVYSTDDVRHDKAHPGFLAGATCLGDILKARGYRNVFLEGAPLSFSGKGLFLQQHGYDERWGKEEWEAAGARPPGSADPELGGWGLFDHALLSRARDELAKLHASGQPFNLTLLTLDTHNPHGFVSPQCGRSQPAGHTPGFPDIVACTSSELAAFVRFCRDSGYLKDTTVVVIGDHLAVGNPVEDKLRSAPGRRIFNLFLGAEPFPPRQDTVVTVDMFPTLLQATGLRTSDGRLGLGRSAWMPATPPSAWVRHPNLPALAASPAYRSLWEGLEGSPG